MNPHSDVTAQDFERLVLAPDLHLTRHQHLLTVATSRWEPGVFVYDLEYLTIETKPHHGGVKVALGSLGAHFTYQVLRFELDGETFARFEAFIGRMRAHRELLRAQPSAEKAR